MRRTPTAPYLGVPPPTFSISSTTAGAFFTLSVTVHNDGSALADLTTSPWCSSFACEHLAPFVQGSPASGIDQTEGP